MACDINLLNSIMALIYSSEPTQWHVTSIYSIVLWQ